MSMFLYQTLVYVHLLAALFWLGGMFFLAVVGAPTLRRVEPAELRARLFHDLGMGFRRPAWVAIGILIVTGVWILHLRGVLRWEILGDPAWWTTPWGRALFWKLVSVALMVGLSAVHDFVIGPRSSKAAGILGESGKVTAEASGLRRQAALLARVTGVVGLVLIYLATRLARGG
jgi:copper resistance protein D